MSGISTEQAATAFNLGGGAIMGLASVFGARKMERYPADTIPLRNVVVPIAIIGVGIAAGTILLPDEVLR